MADIPQWVQFLIATASGGAGVYAAIRADLAALRARMDAQELHAAITRDGLKDLHKRVDSVIRIKSASREPDTGY